MKIISNNFPFSPKKYINFPVKQKKENVKRREGKREKYLGEYNKVDKLNGV